MCTVPTQLATDLNAAAQAAVISLSGINPINCPEIDMDETWAGGKLIFSDSPETPPVRGKLYEDTNVPATAGTDFHRIYLYHVNGKASGKMKFAVLIKNLGGGSATLQIQKKGTAGPSTSFLYAGKLAYQRWLTSAPSTAVTVPVGGTVRLDATFDATLASPGFLMHGIWDYSMTETHQVTIVALDQNDNPLTAGPTLPVLARDTHQRGTFPNCEKVFDTSLGSVYDTVQDIESFPLAGNGVNDTNAVGVDATDGTPMTLAGNYGVNYRMHWEVVSSDGRKVGVLVNPRGGAWGGATWAMPGILVGGKFLIPSTTGSVNVNTSAALLGKWNPSTGLSIWAQFMPIGGSSFPVRFVFVPF